MKKNNCFKITATGLTAFTIIQSVGAASNLISVNAFASENAQYMEELKVIKKGTEIAKNIDVNITNGSAVSTTSATVILNDDVVVEVSKKLSVNEQAEMIFKRLIDYKKLNVNINMNNGQVINRDIQMKDGTDIDSCGWLTRFENEYDDNIIVTARTKDISFEQDGIKYSIGSFEYTTKSILLSQLEDEVTDPGNKPDSGDKDDTNSKPDSGDKDDTNDKPGQETTPAAVKLVLVTIDGTERVGKTLSATVKNNLGNVVNSGLTYSWYRLDNNNSKNGVLVGNNSEYKLVKDDQSKYIKLVVSDGSNSVSDITGRIGKRSSSSSSSSSKSSSSSSSSKKEVESSNDSSINSNETNNSINNNNSVSAIGTATIKQDLNGTLKLVDVQGNTLTGWQQIGNEWYLGNADGQALTGWQNVGGSWYFMSSIGTMTTGWQNVGGKWYLMNSSGAMTTGWQQTGGKWYFLQSSGEMTTGWFNDNGTWYYLNSDGSMASNTYVDGYYVGSNGAWIK